MSYRGSPNPFLVKTNRVNMITDKDIDTLNSKLLLLGFTLTYANLWKNRECFSFELNINGKCSNNNIYVNTFKRRIENNCVNVFCDNCSIGEYDKNKKEALDAVLGLIKEVNR